MVTLRWLTLCFAALSLLLLAVTLPSPSNPVTLQQTQSIHQTVQKEAVSDALVTPVSSAFRCTNTQPLECEQNGNVTYCNATGTNPYVGCGGNREACMKDPIYARAGASCVLYNVCFGQDYTDILYFLDPDQVRLGVIVAPPPWIHLGHSPSAPTARIRAADLLSTPRFENRTLGLTALYVENEGHILGDEVMALFFLFEKFNIDLDPNTFVVTNNRYSTKQYAMLVPPDRIWGPADVANRCFRRVLLGTPDTGYVMRKPAAGFSGHQHSMLRFKAHAAATLGLSLAKPNKHTYNVVIALKDMARAHHKQGWRNAHECVSHLTARYPSWNVTAVVWETLTLKEAVELVSRAHVFVSPPGARAMNALFLPRGGVNLLLCQVGMGVPLWPSSEAPPLFYWVPWTLHVQACHPELIRFIPDRPLDLDMDPVILGNLIDSLRYSVLLDM